MTWTFWNWVLCNVLVAVGIVIFTYLLLGFLLCRFHQVFYSMVAKLFNIKRAIIDVNNEIVRKNNEIYVSKARMAKAAPFISKLCRCCKDVAGEDSESFKDITTQPISNIFSRFCSGGVAPLVATAGKELKEGVVDQIVPHDVESSSIDPVPDQPSQSALEQRIISLLDLGRKGAAVKSKWSADVDGNDITAPTATAESATTERSLVANKSTPEADEKIPQHHPAHPEYEREILDVYGKYLTLDKKRNKFLIMTISVVVISSIIIAGFQGCVLANITVYQDGPCPYYGLMDCYYGPNLTYFQCTPNMTLDFPLITSSATCFRWIAHDISVSDVMTQIGACTGLLTAFGSVVEFLLRLLLFVFQQRPGVAAGIRRMMEKTVGINKITQPCRCCCYRLRFHFGVLPLNLYQRPWLVVIFFLLYALLPMIAVTSIVLMSYFRISITALTYIILITSVLICCLALLWILWEENEIGRIMPGSFQHIGEVAQTFKTSFQKAKPLFEAAVSKSGLEKFHDIADNMIKKLHNDTSKKLQELTHHTEARLASIVSNFETTLQTNGIRQQLIRTPHDTFSTIQSTKQLTGSAQEIRARKEAERLKDLGSGISRKS